MRRKAPEDRSALYRRPPERPRGCSAPTRAPRPFGRRRKLVGRRTGIRKFHRRVREDDKLEVGQSPPNVAQPGVSLGIQDENRESRIDFAKRVLQRHILGVSAARFGEWRWVRPSRQRSLVQKKPAPPLVATTTGHDIMRGHGRGHGKRLRTAELQRLPAIVASSVDAIIETNLGWDHNDMEPRRRSDLWLSVRRRSPGDPFFCWRPRIAATRCLRPSIE